MYHVRCIQNHCVIETGQWDYLSKLYNKFVALSITICAFWFMLCISVNSMWLNEIVLNHLLLRYRICAEISSPTSHLQCIINDRILSGFYIVWCPLTHLFRAVIFLCFVSVLSLMLAESWNKSRSIRTKSNEKWFGQWNCFGCCANWKQNSENELETSIFTLIILDLLVRFCLHHQYGHEIKQFGADRKMIFIIHWWNCHCRIFGCYS